MSGPLANTRLRGSNLVSFQAEITPQSRADIADCLLFAELSASGSFSREKQWEQWIGAYQQVLGGLGLSRGAIIDRPQVRVKKRGDFQREATRLINTMPSPHLAELANTALDTMFNSEHARAFYRSWFSWGRSDSFQLIPCGHASAGTINIALCGLQMVTMTKPNLVFDPLLLLLNPSRHELTVLLKGGNFVFSLAAYTGHRQRVQKALHEMGAAQIGSLDL